MNIWQNALNFYHCAFWAIYFPWQKPTDKWHKPRFKKSVTNPQSCEPMWIVITQSIGDSPVIQTQSHKHASTHRQIYTCTHTQTHTWIQHSHSESEWVNEWTDRQTETQTEREREKRETACVCVCVCVCVWGGWGGGGGGVWMHMHLQKYPYPMFQKCAWVYVCIAVLCIHVFMCVLVHVCAGVRESVCACLCAW